jgi:sugar transferase EpsL
MTMGLFPRGVPVPKRVLDLVLTIPGVVLLSPLLGVLACLVWAVHGAPILFRHRRPGLRGEPFTLLKFRTMRDLRTADGRSMPDEVRLTALGRFLRSFSLDELPEVFNILKGEMSLVGPRPLLMEYLSRYSSEQARRHEVLPGLTGWAQVNGRNALTWEQKFAYDVWYVDHWSIGLDLRILALTLLKTVTREGISQPGHATAQEFKGQEPPRGGRL